MKKPMKKLGHARKHRYSDLEKMFLTQQPFLQTYFNGMAKKLADEYQERGTPARITITVIPTFAEKIYNVMTEIIPENAKSQDEVLRLTRYIRFKEHLDAQATIILENEKPEPNVELIASLLPDRLLHDFVTVKRIDEQGKEVEVQLRQETVVALDWIEDRCKALSKLLDDEGTNARVAIDFGYEPDDAVTMMRVLYDPKVNDHAIIVKREGVKGEVSLVKDLGPIHTVGLTEDQTPFEKLSVYEQSEVERFLEGVVAKTFPWSVEAVVTS